MKPDTINAAVGVMAVVGAIAAVGARAIGQVKMFHSRNQNGHAHRKRDDPKRYYGLVLQESEK